MLYFDFEKILWRLFDLCCVGHGRAVVVAQLFPLSVILQHAFLYDAYHGPCMVVKACYCLGAALKLVAM